MVSLLVEGRKRIERSEKNTKLEPRGLGLFMHAYTLPAAQQPATQGKGHRLACAAGFSRSGTGPCVRSAVRFCSAAWMRTCC